MPSALSGAYRFWDFGMEISPYATGAPSVKTLWLILVQHGENKPTITKLFKLKYLRKSKPL
ncbi:hypothetical protein NIES4071_82820 [Calothrix sp. NIES-4071]|nr:hypothetical protein NIES4071_82820 [Calothrix sp. NIES-4071]BAZ62551.1 hypothetical protein NIES4105_82750 [Calothrix sp. NIES-4105]